nr:hypothetical protein [Tanacetum cinerariifolium]
MKTKRKLVPKSNPDTGDRNVGPLDVVDRTHDVDSKALAKKQRVGSSSFVSCRPIKVGLSGVQNVPTVGGAALSTTNVTQPTLTSQRCNTLKSNPDTENRNVAPLDVSDRIRDVSLNAFTKSFFVSVLGNQSVVTPIFQQPEFVPSTVNNRSRARRDRTRRNAYATDRSSSRRQPPSGPPLEYKDLGNCAHSFQHCGALFWFQERLI